MRSISGSVMRGLWLDGQMAGLSPTAAAREGVCLSGGTAALPPVLWSEVRTGLDVVLSPKLVNCCTVLEWTGCSAHV